MFFQLTQWPYASSVESLPSDPPVLGHNKVSPFVAPPARWRWSEHDGSPWWFSLGFPQRNPKWEHLPWVFGHLGWGIFHGAIVFFSVEEVDFFSREKTKRKKKLILGTKIGMVVHSLKQTVRPCKYAIPKEDVWRCLNISKHRPTIHFQELYVFNGCETKIGATLEVRCPKRP